MPFRFTIAIFALTFLFSCKPTSENRSRQIIKKAINAHDRLSKWEKLESFSFHKETFLFLEDGALESQMVQRIEIRFKPVYEIKMAWEKDSISHLAHFDGAKTRYWLGENEIMNQDFLSAKKRDLDAAAYVMTKPFDLLDGESALEYLGLYPLSDVSPYETVQVVDGFSAEGVQVDVWKYYFDPETSLVKAYSVRSADHESLVINEDLEEVDGILFPKNRESYRMYSDGRIHFKRAEYTYSGYKLKFEE